MSSSSASAKRSAASGSTGENPTGKRARRPDEAAESASQPKTLLEDVELKFVRKKNTPPDWWPDDLDYEECEDFKEWKVSANLMSETGMLEIGKIEVTVIRGQVVGNAMGSRSLGGIKGSGLFSTITDLQEEILNNVTNMNHPRAGRESRKLSNYKSFPANKPYPDAGMMYLHTIHVEEGYRRQGLGGFLIDTGLRKLDELCRNGTGPLYVKPVAPSGKRRDTRRVIDWWKRRKFWLVKQESSQSNGSVHDEACDGASYYVRWLKPIKSDAEIEREWAALSSGGYKVNTVWPL